MTDERKRERAEPEAIIKRKGREWIDVEEVIQEVKVRTSEGGKMMMLRRTGRRH